MGNNDMKHITVAAILAALMIVPGSVRADCRDDVRELRKDINDDRKDYTADARLQAKEELAAAQLTLSRPLKCREHLVKARLILQQGKR